MRELDECRAEVFRRSEKRIKERRKYRAGILLSCVPLCMAIAVWLVTATPPVMDGEKSNAEMMAVEDFSPDDGVELSGSIDSFSFSLTWDCYGIGSYDSKTGKLVKTKDATHPEDYVTTCWLTDEQKRQIYDWIMDLNVTSYPDTYNPHGNGLDSSPSMTLILTVNTATIQKTITAEDIALTYESNDPKGQKFLRVCKAIRDILIETEEWKALPEYEFFYD